MYIERDVVLSLYLSLCMCIYIYIYINTTIDNHDTNNNYNCLKQI